MQDAANNKTLLILFFITLANILFLDIWLIFNHKSLRTASKPDQEVNTLLQDSSPAQTAGACPQSCINAIDEATSSISLTPPPVLSPTSKQNSVKTPQQGSISTSSLNSVKEFFIPLGTGTNSASDWTDVPGVKAEVDSAKYGKIQKVLFEASTHVPNAAQIVEVRLYNETDKYIVSNSELSFPSGTSQNFRIAEIILGQGSKTYKVQMRTQLQYQAVLDQSRIHITTY